MLKSVSSKPVMTAAAVLALAGTSYVYAQQGFGNHGRFEDGSPRVEYRHRLSAADMAAFTDARIAALKAGLQLTPDQTKNWPPFEQAVRDMAQLRIQRMQARQAADQQAPSPPFDRLARRADNMAKASAALKKIADAGAPLYQSLNDEQKGRFVVLARMLRPQHRMHGFMERWRQERFGEGGGQNGDGRQHRWEQGGLRFGQQNGEQGDQESQL